MTDVDKMYLEPTAIIDCDNKKTIDYAMDTVKSAGADPVAKAVALYYAVRDNIWYDPYSPFYLPEHYRASNVLERGRGYCVGKASLLCALGRVCGIPTRVGFATVRNHLATKEYLEFLGSDLFVYHGFTELYLEGKWIKATPAFNVELCKKHRVPPLEFNGREDSVFHAFDLDNKKFMDYLEDHGTYADIPIDTIISAWEDAYGKDRVQSWKDLHRRFNGNPLGNFDDEEVVK